MTYPSLYDSVKVRVVQVRKDAEQSLENELYNLVKLGWELDPCNVFFLCVCGEHQGRTKWVVVVVVVPALVGKIASLSTWDPIHTMVRSMYCAAGILVCLGSPQ